MTHSSTVSTLDLDGFVGGKSGAIVALQNLALEVACTGIPVLLVGESGTGKQVLARHIHRLAGRLDHEFLRVPCAAAKPDLFSSPISFSEHSKGAGTIFLDDIGELDISAQRALLSALPDGDGPSASGLLSGRLISATNQNLEKEIRSGRFRSELFYRISGVCLHLPPLRERKEDIPELVEFFVGKHSVQLGRSKPCISAEAMSLFTEYGWPGNIRHLENV